MTMALSRWLLFGLLMLIAGWVHAENGCPPGFEPTGMAPSPQDPVACRPIQRNNEQQTTPQPPAPIWVSQWGAVATDAKKGILGTAANIQSKSEAERIAISACQSKGGSECNMNLSYDNECVAMVSGAKGYNVNADTTVVKAVAAGMKTCSADGDVDCHAYYTECSLPVQLQ